MIALIWLIYVLIVGKFQIYKTIGLKGKVARVCAILGFLVYLGVSFIMETKVFIRPMIDSQDYILRLIIIPIGLIFVSMVGALLIGIAIHGNDFKQTVKTRFKEEKTSYITCTCGRKLPPQAKFCPNCGKQIEV
ncbi:MAG: zinc-ribbon domain-containing protein [candidate division WOR-3 bacterium]